MKLNAQPNPAADLPKTFWDAYNALSDAYDAVDDALRLVRGMVLSPANYQHLDDDAAAAAAARAADLLALADHSRAAQVGIGSICDAIMDAANR
jgi:hypothetical protein